MNLLIKGLPSLRIHLTVLLEFLTKALCTKCQGLKQLIRIDKQLINLDHTHPS